MEDLLEGREATEGGAELKELGTGPTENWTQDVTP